MAYAPVALFIYNRPQHVRRTLELLSACKELESSPLYIYCDEAKGGADDSAVKEARRAAHSTAPRHATFVERERNMGLAASIIDGTTALCAKFGKVIIVEDDLEVAPGFLTFLNEGLERYTDNESVMQISGYQFPVAPPLVPTALFMRFPTSWGWATWQRAWMRFDPTAAGVAALAADPAKQRAFDLDGSYPYYDMLQRQMRGETDSWAIRWYLTMFEHGGLALFPGTSLVKNAGFDGSGRHGQSGQGFDDDLARATTSWSWPAVEVDVASQRRVFSCIAANRPRSRTEHLRQLAARIGRRVLSHPRVPLQIRNAATALVEKLAGTQGTQDLELYWDPEMAAILETWGHGNAWNEIQLLLANARGTVIDIACGPGTVMEILGAYPALDVHGFDISDFFIGKALERGIPRDHLSVADATATKYSTNQFDYGYSIGSLEHFTNDGIIGFVKEAHRITRKVSMHNIPTSRSGRDEGWMKLYQSYHNNSVDWWLERFRSSYGDVRVLDSAWNDKISVGKWFICTKEMT